MQMVEYLSDENLKAEAREFAYERRIPWYDLVDFVRHIREREKIDEKPFSLYTDDFNPCGNLHADRIQTKPDCAGKENSDAPGVEN
jgi:hypothetical protein